MFHLSPPLVLDRLNTRIVKPLSVTVMDQMRRVIMLAQEPIFEQDIHSYMISFAESKKNRNVEIHVSIKGECMVSKNGEICVGA